MMARITQRHLSASVELVTSTNQRATWFPRCAAWIGGATGPTPGARFKGTNKRGILRWSTEPEVVTADRGREFAFIMHGKGPSTKWRYRFEPVSDGGTDLVESFEMAGDLPAMLVLADRYLMGIDDRKADLEDGMRRTLERIRAVAEGST